MDKQNRSDILQGMVDQLDLPDYIIEQAINRYNSLGEWFNREASDFKDIEVEIFPQGSFALGTTIKPIDKDEEYDLDMGCKIKINAYKSLYSQKHLKDKIGEEMELYRKSKRIKEELEEKHRCWRLEYQDEVEFHIDIVPCIPLEDIEVSEYNERIKEFYNYKEQLTDALSSNAINITDDRNDNYNEISEEWLESNPQGYQEWFHSRMFPNLTENIEMRADIIPIKFYNQKSVLQRCIQLLKRHRDNMFGDDERKPISVIITTLASNAYKGESDLSLALMNILEYMPTYINSTSPRIPNPVNPLEDFADRWDMEGNKELDLEDNFYNWLKQAKIDFDNLLNKNEAERTILINEKLGINISALKASTMNDTKNKFQESTFNKLPKTSPKPWGDRYFY